MAKVVLKPRKMVNRIVAREAAPAIRDKADEIAGKAEAGLARHSKTGDARIGVEHGRVDSVVYMEASNETDKGGIAPLAIEFGHKTEGGQWVDGMYIITKASGLA